MRENPLVSIITPSYNQGHFIEETIQSVLEQDYPHIEYIVIDGGSTDNTVSILKKYSHKLCWTSKRDKGQSEAVNKGFKRAKGDIIGWINSDDTYMPQAVGKVVDYFKANPEKKLLYGNGYAIGEDSIIIRPYCADPDAQKRLPELFNICQPTMFMRREVLKAVGLLDESLHYCMDYDFVIRAAEKYTLGYLDEALANIRFYKGNKSFDYDSMHTEVIKLQKKYFGKVSYNQLFAYANEYIKRRLAGDKFSLSSGRFINAIAMLFSLYQYAIWNRKLPFWEFSRWLYMKLKLRTF